MAAPRTRRMTTDTHTHTATDIVWSKWYLLAPSGEELHCMGDSKQHSRAYHQEKQQFQNVNPVRGLQVQRLPKRHNSHRPWMEQYFTPRTDNKVSFYSEHWVLVARGFHPAGNAERWSQWTHFLLQAKDHIHYPPGMDTAWVSQRPYNTQLGRRKYASDLEQRNVFPNKTILPSGCEGSTSM